ncbi:hypothetical protein JYU23_00085 [bacterium AH-315-C07]|nr:hypothetical protein [bacterium AH-315-C07]
MDHLADIIQSLSNDDVKEFRIFINRQKKKDSRKDLELFGALHSDSLNKKEVAGSLYSDNNKNAYHSLRKRLIKHITEFIILKNNKEDITRISSIMGQMSLAEYLFRKKRTQAAWHYLEKAEDQAIKTDRYQLLNNIYYTQIENSDSEFAPELRSIIKKKKENLRLAQIDDKGNTVNHLIRLRLKNSSQSGTFNIQEIVSGILKDYELEEQAESSPKFMYNMVSIIRSNIIANKDYEQFELYVINVYKKLIEKDVFGQHNHLYKVQLLYIIGHVLYRNKKFKAAKQYLKSLYHELNLFNKAYFDLLYPSYVILKGNISAYSGDPQLAIDLEEDLLKSSKYKMEKIQSILIRLNLAAHYAQVEDYSSALKTMAKIPHSDNWFIKNLGMERALKKQILESALYFEIEENELAENRIRSLKKAFRRELESGDYPTERGIVDILVHLLKDPGIVNTSEFKQEVNELVSSRSVSHEDLQSTIFIVWLTAKASRKSYTEIIGKYFAS